MKQKGAFEQACEYVINKDIINNPDKYPKFTGVELGELIFGDYQRFVDKWVIKCE